MGPQTFVPAQQSGAGTGMLENNFTTSPSVFSNHTQVSTVSLSPFPMPAGVNPEVGSRRQELQHQLSGTTLLQGQLKSLGYCGIGNH